ncbi:PE-PGRS family protein OS=Kitasatospora aureofaciens OX=1894 GN=GCM10010502_68730 PE=4 SV=1 [Kitasatospora aureofaciens]
MTDTTRPDPARAAAPERLELAPCSSRPAPADRDLGRPILDSPLVRGSMWLRWTRHDGIRTLHHGADLARGWVEKDVDGLDGWVALVDGRIVRSARPGLAVPEPVVHAESWEAGATLHAALAQHPNHPEHAPDEDDDQEHGLLGGIRSRVRRKAAGMTLETIQQALHRARDDERAADRHADVGDEAAYATAAAVCAEWQRVRDHTAATRAERYDPDHDTALQHALRREHHRQDVAACAREATHQARQTTDAAHRRLAGTAAQPLYTALDRAGLHALTDDDHQAVRDLTRTLDPATLRQVMSWLERTRTAAFALRGTGQASPVRPVVRRRQF